MKPAQRLASMSIDDLQSMQVYESIVDDQLQPLEVEKATQKNIQVKLTEGKKAAESELQLSFQSDYQWSREKPISKMAVIDLISQQAPQVTDQQTIAKEVPLMMDKPKYQSSTAGLVAAETGSELEQVILEKETELLPSKAKSDLAETSHELQTAIQVDESKSFHTDKMLRTEVKKQRAASVSMEQILTKSLQVAQVEQGESVATLDQRQPETDSGQLEWEQTQPLYIEQHLPAESEQELRSRLPRSRRAILQPSIFKNRSLSVERVQPLQTESRFQTREQIRRRASVSLLRCKALQNSSQTTLDSQDSGTCVEASPSATASVSYSDLRAIQIQRASRLEKEQPFSQSQRIYSRLLPMVELKPTERIQHFQHSSMFNVPSNLGKLK